MIEHIFEIIHIIKVIIFGILFIVYPYFIFYFFIISGGDDDFDWYMYIPGITHTVSVMMIIIMMFTGLSKLIKIYYKLRYRVSKETLKQRKIIDPYDEEEWGDDWENKLKENKFYNFWI